VDTNTTIDIGIHATGTLVTIPLKSRKQKFDTAARINEVRGDGCTALGQAESKQKAAANAKRQLVATNRNMHKVLEPELQWPQTTCSNPARLQIGKTTWRLTEEEINDYDLGEAEFIL